MLSLTELLTFRCINSVLTPATPQPFHRLGVTCLDDTLSEEHVIEVSPATWWHIVWSFLRVMQETVGRQVYPSFLQLLESVVVTENHLSANVERDLNEYWARRLLHSQMNHEDSMTRLGEDAFSAPKSFNPENSRKR